MAARIVRQAALAVALGLLLWSAPGAAQQRGGPPVTISGILDVIVIDDFEGDRSSVAHFIRDSITGQVTQLRFERPPVAGLETGDLVTIHGNADNGQVWVSEIARLQDDSSLDETAPAETTAAAPTVHDTVVLLVDFDTDGDGTADVLAEPHSVATVREIMFDGIPGDGMRSVRGVFMDASLGTVSFEGDVFGPFVINESVDSCPYYNWAAAAESAATNSGVNLANYKYRILVLPHWSDIPGCTWAGLGNVGCGTFCRTWISEGNSPQVYAHELGHNKSMAHAGTDPEADRVINSPYGDGSDVMGSSRRWHMFNGAHADQMGWQPTTTVTGSGGHRLFALELDPAVGTQIIKIRRSDGYMYYITYRQPIGYDDELSTTYTQGVNIHWYLGGGYSPTAFVDSLVDSEFYYDSDNGLTITQLGRGPDYVDIDIAFGCAAQAPTVGVSPASQTAALGTELGYTVTVTNRDNDQCDATIFALQDSYFGGITGSLSVTTMTLAPGASDTALVTLDPMNVNGTYSFQVEAIDSVEHAGKTGVGSGTAIFDGTAPTAPQNLTASVKRKTQVQLTWDAASDGGGSGIAYYTLYRDDGATIGPIAGTSYTDTDTVSGATYTYVATAHDNVGLESPDSAPLNVVLGGKGGGGGGKGGGNNGGGKGGGPKK